MTPRSLLLSALLVAACGEGSENNRAEVGTGWDIFTPVGPSTNVPIVCGPQGGQHIWMSIRVRDLDPDAAHVTLRIRYADDALAAGRYICGQEFDQVHLIERDGWSEFAGVVCYVSDPAAVQGRPLRLEGIVTDRFGEEAAANASFSARGPDPACGF